MSMASPAVSTPSAAGSPPAVTLAPAPPALAMQTSRSVNMASIAVAPGVSTSTTMITRKEWVIPPRPKPGRKPATDTPPTKRKAQNRAAQRAFRERRAARVGELEEQLDESKDEHQRREAELRGKVVRLEADLERFKDELQSWRLRCDTLDRIADYERREKESAHAELAYLRNGSRTTGTEPVPLPPRRLRQTQQHATITHVYAQDVPSPAPDMEELGCGRCSSLTDCACVDDALTMATSGCGNCSADTHCACLAGTLNAASQVSMVMKRPHSPSAELVKRQRQTEPSTPLEIDFTNKFATKPAQPAQPAPVIVQARPLEPCGFCEIGSYCMCADAAAAAAAVAVNPGNEREHENRLPPLLNEVTPPPSDNDVDSINAKLPSMQPHQMHRPVTSQAPRNSCANGPGSCQQCQNDPKSGMFCRSLAKLRASSTSTSTPPEGCCGGIVGGGCCKSVSAAAPSEPPPTLSCADAYKTLSSHKDFDKASGDLDNWIVSLHATPLDHAGRAPIEVEAASVMQVLKHFDRRFGRGEDTN